MNLRTILPVYTKTRFDLSKKQAKTIPLQNGTHQLCLLIGYTIDPKKLRDILNVLLLKKYTVIITTPKLPVNPLIDERVIYIETPAKWMGMSTFKESGFKKLNFVMGIDQDGQIEAQRVRQKWGVDLVTDLSKPLPHNKKVTIKDLEKSQTFKVLFDTNHEASGRGLGDILMSTAVIREFRNKYPQAEITYTTRLQAKAILQNNPHVDKLITEPYNKTEFIKTLDEYDKHFFLGRMTEDYTDKRNNQLRVNAMADLFEIELKNNLPEIHLTPSELAYGQQYIEISKHNVVCCIEAQDKGREWNQQQLQQLINSYSSKKINFIVVGAKETHYKNCKNLTGKTTIRQMMSIVANADIVVTMDNFVSHIAGAFDKPCIALYSTIPAELRSSHYTKTIPIQSLKECSPCLNKYRFPNRDFACDYDCAKEITVDTVKQEFDKLLKDTQKQSSQSLESLFGETPEAPVIQIKDPSNTLFISLWRRFGDCLFGIPSIKEIRRLHPKATIIWGTHYYFSDIVRRCPYIDGYVLFQGRVEDGWDAYIPICDKQVIEYVKALKPERIYDLHISPDHNEDLKKKNHSIVEYVGYELAKLKNIDPTLEYFPDIRKQKRVQKDFKQIKKNYTGIVLFNGRCFSPLPRPMWDEKEHLRLLNNLKDAGYYVLHVGHLTDECDTFPTYHFSCLDYLYYAIQEADLFIGFDSGMRNLALTVPDSKIISLENSMAYENKSDIRSLSKSLKHVAVNMEKEDWRSAYVKAHHLLEGTDLLIKEYNDILDNQFIRRRQK